MPAYIIHAHTSGQSMALHRASPDLVHPDHLHLDKQTLNFVSDSTDALAQIALLVGGDAGSDDSTGDTAGTAKRDLRRDVDVGDVLVFLSSASANCCDREKRD